MNPLKALHEYGQSVWLDFMRRSLIGPELTKLIDEDGLMGMTSNPSIFEKAIGHSADYDGQFAEIMSAGDAGASAIYEQLAIRDIQLAADRLKPIYLATDRRDGYVSLEVSPYLAMQTEATIAEARDLWRRVDRPNVMIKVPATDAGIPAIRTLISEGINVNVTLIFAESAYFKVAEAFIAGLEQYGAGHGDLGHIASVASVFISRIDTLADAKIDAALQAGENDTELLHSLHGQVAIANAKLMYQRYKQLFSGPRWAALATRGAQTQRLLWASTGTKNPAYSDVLYVEELIGADTVNTMPPATMDAFRDHGEARATIETNLDAARRVIVGLNDAGISLTEITDQLLVDGVQLFADAADALLKSVETKRVKALGDRLNGLSLALPKDLQGAVDHGLEQWRAAGAIRRLWAHDTLLWSGEDEDKWLGWLDIPARMRAHLPALTALAETAKAYDHILLLGMGGSSLGPEVLAETFGHLDGHPEIHVLDSTDPAQIRAFEAKIDLARTLFIVSSKSGGTLEPNILKQYFFTRASAVLGAAEAGKHFIAITDPGSKMQRVAEADHFGHVFFGDPSIGGRYSVLSPFGIVPAAATGIDVARFLDATDIMVRACGPGVPPGVNPGVVLGMVFGHAGLKGRDKLTILAGPGLEDFGAWAEQLIAESTGKDGKGLIPIDAEPLGTPEVYGDDRLFVHLSFAGRPDSQVEALDALEAAGQPVLRITLADAYQLGQEFYRWEIATAVAGSLLGINPFNQPDVEASKIATKQLTDAYEQSGHLPPEAPFLEVEGIKLFADPANAHALLDAAGTPDLDSIVKAHLARLKPHDYAGFLAYIPRDAATIAALQAIRRIVRDASHAATAVGFGPRFLHSTGQDYKGGPNTGVFTQITCDDAEDLAVPGQSYSFGTVKAAQARGDFDVLAERHRRALRIHLSADIRTGLDRLTLAIRRAVG